MCFFHDKLLSCAFFFKTYVQNKLFGFFMYQDKILILYFLCINDKHFSRAFSIYQRQIFISCFLCITDKYFITWYFPFFIFICDKYVPYFFYLSIKNVFPQCFFLYLSVTKFVLYFFYVSMINMYPVFFYLSMKIICHVF